MALPRRTAADRDGLEDHGVGAQGQTGAYA